MTVEPGFRVFASAFFNSDTSAAPPAPATGAKPHDWKIGANLATTAGGTPVTANGVAIGGKTWPPSIVAGGAGGGGEAGPLTACAPERGAPLTLFTNSANSREFSLNEISENET